jgi:hypothetical protein
MKTLTKAEADALDPATLRSMGAHIRSTDDGVIIYESEGEIPAPPITPPGLPALPWRDFLDLIEIDLNIRPAVDAYLAEAPQRARDEFARTLSFERNHPLLVDAIAALDLDPAEVDEAWRVRAPTSS